MKRRFRGKFLDISVKNDAGVEKGVVKVVVNGKEIQGNVIPVSALKDQNDISVEMG